MRDIIVIYTLTFALAWPLGRYMARVFQGEKTWLDPLMAPLERAIYWLLGVRPGWGMDWRGYARALLFSNLFLGVAA